MTPLPTPWASRLEFVESTHKYFLDGKPIPSVSTILTLSGVSKGYDHIPRAILDNAAARGHMVHEAAQMYLEGRLDCDSLDPRLEGYHDALFQWVKDHKVEPLLLETPIFSEKWWVSGTFDFYGRHDGHLTVIDFKTTTQALRPHRVQTAGYAAMLREHGLKVEKRACLYFRRDGKYELKPHGDPEEDLIWAAAVMKVNFDAPKAKAIIAEWDLRYKNE